MAQVEAFSREQGMEDIEPLLKKGALIAQNPRDFESLPELDEADRAIIRRETTRPLPFSPPCTCTYLHVTKDKWSQPSALYMTVVICSLAAAVQSVSTYTKFLSIVERPI
jgi:hypothetical protein